jgi:hypothetical protein
MSGIIWTVTDSPEASSTKVTTTLLGAGASRDAGLPVSVDLTKEIGRALESDARGDYEGTTQAFQLAVGALIAFDTSAGRSAFAGIDVERLFSAIQMLANRNQAELTPFVSSWNPGMAALARTTPFPMMFGRDLISALSKSDNWMTERVFKAGVEAIMGTAVEPIFDQLQKRMLRALHKALSVDSKMVDYLAPLLSVPGHPKQIVTLNYDRSIESLAEQAKVTLDTGVEAWSGAYNWNWSDTADLRLLKLHGSLDWWSKGIRATDGRLPEEKILVGSGLDQHDDVKPALIFGQRGKLRTDGPFLAMLGAFDDFLVRSDHLLIVGYSFRDDHVNASIRRWFNAKPGASVTIIDPVFEGVDVTQYYEGTNFAPFLEELIDGMLDRGKNPPYNLVLRPQHKLLGMTAAAGLNELYGNDESPI